MEFFCTKGGSRMRFWFYFGRWEEAIWCSGGADGEDLLPFCYLTWQFGS